MICLRREAIHPMDKRHKDIMRSLVIRLRHILVGTPTEADGFLPGNLDRELERVGIAPDGTITPLDALTNLYNGELRIYRVASTLLMPLPSEQRATARHEIIERAAYTWINRLFALRAMEVRDLIESSILRSEEAYGGLSEKMYFLRQDEPERANGPDSGWWAVVEDACRVQAKALPGLFALNDPTAALRPAPAALIQCIELSSGLKPVLPDVQPVDLDAVFADPDAIGWAYQFYQQEAKAAIDAKCKHGGKVVSRAEMSAKTQLFTEPYMVQWLLQNSLGRSYHEAYPHSSLPATWEYYVQPEKLDVADPFGLGCLTLLDPLWGAVTSCVLPSTCS